MWGEDRANSVYRHAIGYLLQRSPEWAPLRGEPAEPAHGDRRRLDMRMNRMSAGVVAAVAGALILSVPSGGARVGCGADRRRELDRSELYAQCQQRHRLRDRAVGVDCRTSAGRSPRSAHTAAARRYTVDELAAFTVGTGAIVTGFTPTLNGTVNTVDCRADRRHRLRRRQLHHDRRSELTGGADQHDHRRDRAGLDLSGGQR